MKKRFKKELTEREITLMFGAFFLLFENGTKAGLFRAEDMTAKERNNKWKMVMALQKKVMRQFMSKKKLHDAFQDYAFQF
jgi:hypothetical protein